MRAWFFVAAAVVLAGCGEVSVKTDQTGEQSVNIDAAAAGGWSAKVLGSDAEKIYIVARPDGMQVAARVEDGKSEIVDAGEAQAAFSNTHAAIAADAKTGGEKVAIKLPGVELNVKADDAEGGPADVNIKAGGTTISVAADDRAGGQAAVNLTGVKEEAARDFIDDAEGLSPEVKAQMKAKLGL